MTRNTLPFIVVGALLCPAAPSRGQAIPEPAFEVASVKAAASGNRTRIDFLPGGRLTVTSMALKTLLSVAYDLREFQIAGGPEWMTSARYDVTAKTESPSATTQEMVRMLRTLLTERFKLAVRSEMKDLPVYELVVDSGGLKLADSADTTKLTLDGGNGRAHGTKVTMGVLSQFLSMQVGRPVIDRTGVSGAYDLTLTWVPDTNPTPSSPDNPRAADSSGPSIFTAVQEQLGLKLTSRRGPVPSIVIEHAERPTEN